MAPRPPHPLHVPSTPRQAGIQPASTRTDAWASGGFVLVWCTGYLAGAVAVSHGGAFTVLMLRFACSALVFAGLMMAAGVRLPAWRDSRHSAVVGVLTMGLQFGGVYAALRLGASPGLSALLIGMMPLAVALGGRLLGERIHPRQWTGFALGLAGVLLVVAERLAQAQITWTACLALLIGLVGISAGTLYQKRHASAIDLRAGLFLQNAMGVLVLLPLAAGLEGFHVEIGWPLAGALAWLVLVNSGLGFGLLFVLIRHGAASKVAALFYLVPPVTAAMSAAMLQEPLGWQEGGGFALAALGVWLASR